MRAAIQTTHRQSERIPANFKHKKYRRQLDNRIILFESPLTFLRRMQTVDAFVDSVTLWQFKIMGDDSQHSRFSYTFLPILPILRMMALPFPQKNEMILRRLLYLTLLLVFAAPCSAQQAAVEIDKIFTAEVLKTTLFARTIEERKFCDYVIQKRDDGTLPTRIIYGVHQKAMEKDRARRFTYFKMALETVCKQEGIVLYPAPVRTQSRTSTTPAWIPSLFRGLF